MAKGCSKTLRGLQIVKSLSYEIDGDGIATLLIDMPGKVNVMNGEFTSDMMAALSQLAENPALKGVVIASGKSTFFAGGDVKSMSAAPGAGYNELLTKGISEGREMIRALELLPVPVAAAINGAALGGGYELTLACNYRVAWNSPGVVIGLPEATLGLLPGGGGCVRMVKKFGLLKAVPYLLNGSVRSAREAFEEGLVDELVEHADDLIEAGKAWVRANIDSPEAATQPWDRPSYSIPGGDLSNPMVSGFANRTSFRLLEETRGLMPNKIRILDIAVEALKLPLDTALKIEGRGLVSCIISPVGKNLMAANFIQSTTVRRAPGRPVGIERQAIDRVRIFGSDDRSKRLVDASCAAGIDAEMRDMTDDDVRTADDCGLLIVGDHAADIAGLLDRLSGGSTPLAVAYSPGASNRDDPRVVQFVHAAVEGHPPVAELIASASVAPLTLAQAYDYFRAIGCVVIVTKDESFLERVEKVRREEAARILADGHSATVVRNVAHAAGFDRDRLGIAPQSDSHGIPPRPSDEELATMRDRLFFAPAVEALRCLDEGVLKTVAEGNVSSLHALDAPQWTGGYLQFANFFGLDAFKERAESLASRFGSHFLPPEILSETIAKERELA